MTKLNIFWFRRDLRIYDNCGLYHALKGDSPVMPVFIFDTNILDKLFCKSDMRVSYIHDQLNILNRNFNRYKSGLTVLYGKPEEVFQKLIQEYDVRNVYLNRDYEPYAIKRDHKIEKLCQAGGIGFHTFKDHLIFERNDILKKNGHPYTVFTPYSVKWKATVTEDDLEVYLSEDHLENLFKIDVREIPPIDFFGFKYTPLKIDFPEINTVISKYHENRSYPWFQTTSNVGIKLRFGTLSIRQLIRDFGNISPEYLNELIWREFFSQILYHFPAVGKQAFKKEYRDVDWLNKEEEFDKWCCGRTGYQLVDAGMRQLNETGWMHNRVRMVTAGFLSKHLLIDWRWGEQYFADKLIDFELASNNGNWQWAAGTGCDAAPYFRIFNPHSQAEKFDPKQVYIKKWIPEIHTADYPEPIINHTFARQRCLEFYKKARNNN